MEHGTVLNHALLSRIWWTNLDLVDPRRMLPSGKHSGLHIVWWRRGSPLFTVKGNVNTTSYKGIYELSINGFGLECPVSSCRCDDQVSTYFCRTAYSVFSSFHLFCFCEVQTFSVLTVWPCLGTTANQLSGHSCHTHTSSDPAHLPKTPVCRILLVVVVRSLCQVCSSPEAGVMMGWLSSFLSFWKALLKLKAVLLEEIDVLLERQRSSFMLLLNKKLTGTTKAWKLPKGPKWSNTRKKQYRD